MKLLSIAIVACLFAGFTQAQAAYKFSLSLCPQDGRNDMTAIHTTQLGIDGGQVDLSYGGSEPQFSSEIQWLQDGRVQLLRKDKETLTLGQGTRPGLREACGTFPFVWNADLPVSLKTKKGLPFESCDENKGCRMVRPRDDQMTITTKTEKIVYEGKGESASSVYLEKVKIDQLTFKQRMGVQLESADVPFKGCVLYLEGLGDSIQNHAPFFDKLTNAGYRVVMFDYPGQGGSEGDMSKTRVNAEGAPFPANADYEIGTQARFVWQRYAQKKDPVFNRSCADSPKRVIGWSLGGLAAYKLASEKWSDVTVLIAPALVPRLCVGETADNCLKNLTLDKVITVRTLTSNTFLNVEDPHVDPVRPASIFKEVKEFGVNLISTGFESRRWPIDSQAKGLVFLSGPSDTYVDRDKTATILAKNAPNFAVVPYDEALHEIDNEIPRLSINMHEKAIQFLNLN